MKYLPGLSTLVVALCCVGCTHSGTGDGFTGGADLGSGDDTGDGGPNTGDDGGGANPDGGGPGRCDNPQNLAGCGCVTPGMTRACYSGPPTTENKGACKDGMQTCVAAGEFSSWGPCSGDVLPMAEVCGDKVDKNCNGLLGCDDPVCAGMVGCCMPGQMRACYDGPMGTEGVGPCKPGTQTCTAQGAWPVACAGEQLPGVELGHCQDLIDNDCNGATDCKDLLCLLDPACRPKQCNPGDMQACYDGPNGTSGVGPCHGGTQQCKQDGSGWGPCSGEVVPGMEGGHCNDGIDNDCNGPIDCKDPACATAPNCCVMMGNGVDGTIYAHSPTTLYTVNPANWNLATVGDFGAGDQMTDLAVTPNGSLYTISFTTLYSVNKANAKAQKIADLQGMSNNSLTFLANGKLIAADGAGDLKQIDPANGNVTAIGNFGNGYSSSGDLVGVADGTMYGISSTGKGGADASGNNILLRVDTGTGVATAIGAIGFGNVWGLAYVNARVIAFTNSGQIIQVDPQTGAGILLAAKPQQFWGAGMSPLVQANPCQ